MTFAHILAGLACVNIVALYWYGLLVPQTRGVYFAAGMLVFLIVVVMAVAVSASSQRD